MHYVTQPPRHLKEGYGLMARILVREPGTVERSVGKAKRVVDLRKR